MKRLKRVFSGFLVMGSIFLLSGCSNSPEAKLSDIFEEGKSPEAKLSDILKRKIFLFIEFAFR